MTIKELIRRYNFEIINTTASDAIHCRRGGKNLKIVATVKHAYIDGILTADVHINKLHIFLEKINELIKVTIKETIHNAKKNGHWCIVLHKRDVSYGFVSRLSLLKQWDSSKLDYFESIIYASVLWGHAIGFEGEIIVHPESINILNKDNTRNLYCDIKDIKENPKSIMNAIRAFMIEEII